MDSYDIIGIYVIFMVILNIASVAFGESFVTNADFLTDSMKQDFSANIFGTLNFLLFVGVPQTSNISDAINVYRGIYWLMVLPFTILIAIVIIRLVTLQGA